MAWGKTVTEQELEEKMEELSKVKDSLNSREREIKEREINAEANFAKENKKSLDRLETQSTSLKNKIVKLEDDFLIKKENIFKEQKELMEKNKSSIESEKKKYEEEIGKIDIDIKNKYEELDKKNKDILEKENSLKDKEKDYAQREEGLVLKEKDAQIGFAEKHQNATAKLKEDIDNLNQKKNDLNKELSEIRSDTLNDLAEFRKNDRKTFLINLEKEREEFQKEREEFQKDLNIKKDSLSTEKNDYNEKQEKFEDFKSKEETKIKLQRMKLQSEENELDSIKEQFEKMSNEKYKGKIESLEMEIESNINTHENYKDEIRELREKIHVFETLKFEFGTEKIEPKRIMQELRNKDKEIDKLKEELFDRPAIKDIAEFNSLKEQKIRDEKKIIEITNRISDLEIENSRNISSVIELESLKEQLKVSKIRLNKYITDVAELENDLKKYTESPSATLESRIGEIEEPVKEFENIRKQKNNKSNEMEWLDNISNKMLESGFLFNSRLVNAFHTSLKISEWSPLTVLAGVSGTGKSELPRLYSRFGGIQFAPIAVQPNWDSSQDIFGFFNYMEQKFNPKQLLRAMAQSQRKASDNKGFNDGLLLVLLDEMNLARIEQYFSDLLSKLELRRGDESVGIDIDLGSGHKYSLNLGRNILYTGTMNEDESTMTLSDKAIDRSNVISFPSPKVFHQRDEIKMAEESGFFKYKTWLEWQRKPSALPSEKREEYKTVIQNINERMRFAGRAVGHRVYQGIEYYIANHPDVCALTDQNGILYTPEDQQKYKDVCQRAFEDQIVQKIMPKLRGIETEGTTKKECIEPIAKIINDKAGALSNDYKNATTKGYGIFNWHTSEYLESEENEHKE